MLTGRHVAEVPALIDRPTFVTPKMNTLLDAILAWAEARVLPTEIAMTRQPVPTEVSIKGRFVGMSILGSAVVFVIFLENLRVTAWLPYVLYILGGALVLAVAIPMLLFRRPVEHDRRT